MRLKNIGPFSNILDFISWKVNLFASNDRNYKVLFNLMFQEENNIMAEYRKNYKTYKYTYGQVKEDIINKSYILSTKFHYDFGLTIGLYMDNSLDFIKAYWILLSRGYNVLLLNTRISLSIINSVLKSNNIQCVISDRILDFSVKSYLYQDLVSDDKLSRDYVSVESYYFKNLVFGTYTIFMSSGTTNNIKLCMYDASCFYYQIGNSLDIVRNCKSIAKHYKGKLKQLCLLPFYHVFGFIAVYLWFGYFSRTLVFIDDLKPDTIQKAVLKHKVTHIFAVPLVWNTIYKKAYKQINKESEKTRKLLNVALSMSNRSKAGSFLTYKVLGRVRQKIFGDSIKFLISGGSSISKDVLYFFNGIGYHIANGYGMTEIGITSVDVSNNKKTLNKASIGYPFINTKYAINDKNELLVKGFNIAKVISVNGSFDSTNYDEYFNTHDLVKKIGNRYYICCRTDDVIVSSSGENINPVLLEESIKLPFPFSSCILSIDNNISIIVSIEEKQLRDYNEYEVLIKQELQRLNLTTEIKHIYITKDSLLDGLDFKPSRKKLEEKILSNSLELLSNNEKSTNNDDNSDIYNYILLTLNDILDNKIDNLNLNHNFFTDLNGTSIEYFEFVERIESKYSIDLKDISSNVAFNEIISIIEDN